MTHVLAVDETILIDDSPVLAVEESTLVGNNPIVDEPVPADESNPIDENQTGGSKRSMFQRKSFREGFNGINR